MNNDDSIGDFAVFERYPDVHITHDNIEHYRALAERRLVINRCQDCGYWIYPHRPLCPECWSWSVKPEQVSGAGTVFMFTLLYQLRDPHSKVHEPVNVAAIELAEQKGLRYLARVVNCGVHEIRHDMPVRLTWVEQDALVWPAFEPIQQADGEH